MLRNRVSKPPSIVERPLLGMGLNATGPDDALLMAGFEQDTFVVQYFGD